MENKITLSELRARGAETQSKKDNSPRGYSCVPTDDIKPGDYVIIDNHFCEVVEDPAPADIVERPTYYGQKGRDLVWFWRAQSAYNLAAMIDGENVTREEYEAARKLLDSCQRYALADAAQWGRANTYEHYANSEQCKQDEKRLDERRARLNGRLSRYGVMMFNYGLFPEIVKIDEEGKKTNCYSRADGVALHFFY